MKRRIPLYGLLACVGIVFILYAVTRNYIVDPGAESFLNRKTGLTRELYLPLWLNVMYIHVAFACMAIASGLINFSSRLLGRSHKLHRMNGYLYILSVLIVVITSGYMAPYATGGKISSMGFNVMNILWPFITITALVQIKRKRMLLHRNWMIRSYAFCFTNMSIHLIAFLFHQGFGFDYADSYTIGIYGSLALLLIIPEIVIRKVFKSNEEDERVS